MEESNSEIQAELERLKKRVQAGRKSLIQAAMKAEDLNGLIRDAEVLREKCRRNFESRKLNELTKALQKTFRDMKS